MKIDRAGVLRGAEFGDGGGDSGGAFTVHWNYFVQVGIALEQALPLGVNGPIDAGFWKRIVQRRRGWEGVDYVAERAEADQEEVLVGDLGLGDWSGIFFAAQAREQIARGMLFGIADDGYANAEHCCELAFGYRVGRVVGALRVDFGLEFAKQ